MDERNSTINLINKKEDPNTSLNGYIEGSITMCRPKVDELTYQEVEQPRRHIRKSISFPDLNSTEELSYAAMLEEIRDLPGMQLVGISSSENNSINGTLSVPSSSPIIVKPLDLSSVLKNKDGFLTSRLDPSSSLSREPPKPLFKKFTSSDELIKEIDRCRTDNSPLSPNHSKDSTNSNCQILSDVDLSASMIHTAILIRVHQPRVEGIG